MTYDASDKDDNPADNPEDGGERIAKALARAGVASRREVERYIEEGRVALNGQVLTTPAVKVKPGDILTVDGEVVGDAEPTRLFRYHKPTGLMTSHNDPQGRPTVFAALPPGLPRLISVGRLDLNSEGLLLLTNDGALSRALELPSSGWSRTYRARAFGAATQEKLDKLKDGITVEGVKYGPIDAKLDKAKDGPSGRNVWITVTLTEGKNREVRRVLEHLGLKVNRLLRLAYGPFVLGTLGQGEIEEVGPRVIREQLEGLVPPQNMPTGDRPQFRGGVSKAMRRGPGGEGAGLTAGRRAPTPKAPAEPKPKTEYKAGWAKPKIKANPHGPAKKPRADGRKFEVERASSRTVDQAPRGGPNRGRTGKVFARAEDVLPGAMTRGPTRAPLREPERKGASPEKPRGPDKARRPDKARGLADKPRPRPEDALREAAAKGAARDAERRGPPAGKPFAGKPAGPRGAAGAPARGSDKGFGRPASSSGPGAKGPGSKPTGPRPSRPGGQARPDRKGPPRPPKPR